MAGPLPKLRQIPSTIASVADYERLARERVSEQAWAYVASGSADEITVAENQAAFQRLWLRGRVLADLAGGNTTLELFGRAFAFPILLGPVAFQKLIHPEGELATVLAASAAQAGMVVSTLASVSLQEIARHAHTPLWFQLYVQPDRGFTAELVRRAEAAGYQALVLTVDAPINGLRNQEQRAGFMLPPGVEAVNLRGMTVPPRTRPTSDAAILFGGPLLGAAPTWADVDWLRSLTRLPILLKGIMAIDDAKTAVEAGMDGIVVSNHGGRILDSQPATIDVLPEIVHAVEGRIPVLMDGGIRRGTDVLKALALGARAVLIGRAFMHGLAAAGPIGVSHVVQILRAELEAAMTLTGCRDLSAIGPSVMRSGKSPLAG